MTALMNQDVTVDFLILQFRKITDWKEAGGKDETIHIINRSAFLGTRVKEWKLNAEGVVPDA
jgi:ABC-type phosphate transport system substrate-binding protein